MQFIDAATVAGSPRRTADGYLIAEARCVRTGIQIYSGDEVGRPDLASVRVYRGPDHVFASDSLQSFSHAPVTVDHPTEQVTADNWKALSVGEVSTAAKQDGEWVILPLILKDAAAIAAVESGKRELSAGYMCALDWTPGKTADGQAYDAQQTQIKINHLALVDRARAGSKARIGDGVWGASPMTEDFQPGSAPNPTEKDNMSDALKTVVLGDKAVQVAVADVAAIEAFKADAAKTLADAKVEHDKGLATKDADLAKKDAEIDALKAKVLDAAAIDKLVADRADLVTKAKVLAKDVKTDGLADADIRKAVVMAILGDSLKDKPATYIDARFDILVEDAVKKAGTADPFREVVKDGLNATNDDAKVVTDAYAAMVQDMQSAHLPAKAN